jgi:hypothetical protein
MEFPLTNLLERRWKSLRRVLRKVVEIGEVWCRSVSVSVPLLTVSVLLKGVFLNDEVM